ncbi:putative hydrolase protein [Botrytis fragariae]|uniref:Putative hydrolase protein n=1 Tax=Botrytis fragariae TaxID=1964551 RepID=A0A8H6AXU1_9HELO|nr:putative hydrolase protein [Botrytis fragariae]KAF5875623.1 putative hydrolase protein [Botrytis fragariae]
MMTNSSLYKINSSTQLNVFSSGTPNSSPALIFLHFWGGSSSTYAPLITLLSSNYYCLALDFRGWGSSTGPQDPDAYHITDLSNDIFSLIPEFLPPSHPFILIGHSMGGKVAMHLSSTIESLSPTKSFPRLQALILLAPAPPTPLILSEEMTKQQLTAYDSIEAATFVIAHVLSSSPLSEHVVNSLATNALAGNQYAKSAWPKYGIQENILEEARNIALPTLVFAGGDDRVETLERVKETLCNLSGVAEERKSLIILDGIGHLMMLEAPDMLSHEIERFVDGIVHVVGQIKD